MNDYFGKDVFKLGFGLMRPPKLKDGSIDIEQTAEMADRFLAAGGTYFDTAHCYDNGGSEKALYEAIVKRHPRETFTIADKLNTWQAHDESSSFKTVWNGRVPAILTITCSIRI
jgi:hypothetical protein